MQVKWEKVETNVGVLEIEVDSEQVSVALDRAFKKVVRQVNIPGFRKGKVPRRLFESRFGVQSLYQDALEILVPDAYTKAVVETKIEPVARPDVDVVQIEAGKPLIFKATVTVKPGVTLGEYKGVEIKQKDFAVTESDIDAELEQMRRGHAEIYTPEDDVTAQTEDAVTIDFTGTIDGEAFDGGESEGYQLEIGSGTFIAGFEEQIVGMKKNEEKDIVVQFPEDYHAPKLAGKDAKFHVVLHELKRKRFPDLDDEFAKDVSEFETLDDLRADAKTRLENGVEQKTKQYIEEQALEKAIEAASIDIPEVMIESEMDAQMEDYKNRLSMQGIPFETYLEFAGGTEETVREQFRESASARVRRDLVIDAIAEAENISISESDITEELERIGSGVNTEVDRVRRVLSMRDPGLTNLRLELRARKIVALIAEHSKLM